MNDAELTALINGVRDTIIASRSPAPMLKPVIVPSSSIQTYAVDLTSANTDLKVTVQRPCRYLQFWVDSGQFDGISVKIGTQSGSYVPLSTLSDLELTPDIDAIYLTNDVRAGRSKLLVFFVNAPGPARLTYGGDPVSLAEQAARLGSISTFDRRGEVMFQDSFEDNLNRWVLSGAGAGYSAALSTNAARSGARSVKMITGATSGNSCVITRNLAYPALNQFGLEAHITSSVDLLKQLTLYFVAGATAYYASLRHDGANGKLQYLNTGGTYTDIVAVAMAIDPSWNLFNSFKIVANPLTRKYVRAIVNDVSYDLSTVALRPVFFGGLTTYMAAEITIGTQENASRFAYVDDAIVTSNEP
jgi:hypothetical protein